MSLNRKREGVIVQSVARALEILRCFDTKDEIGISELSEAVQLSKSTIYGLVNTLTAYGYLEQSSTNKKYRLGIRLFELGNLVQRRMDIRHEAKPYCLLLANKYNTTVHLATHSEGEIIYIDKVDNTNSVVVYSQVGKRAPMYCTGVGKAILAYLPEEYLETFILNRPLERMTKNTIVTKQQLLDELEEVRQRGYAVDNEEIESGLHCIAAPIFNHKNLPVVALSVSFPFGRLWDLDEVARDVRYYTTQISERIGYLPN